MSPGVERFCAWSGTIFGSVFFLGVFLAGLLPPFDPAAGPEEVARFWNDDTDLKRVGLFLMMLSAGFQAPFMAILAVRMKRMEGPSSPLSYTVIAAAGVAVFAILMPVFIWSATAFRPDRDPVTMQAMNDIAWIPFVMNWPPAIIICLATAVAIFKDRGPDPVFPRWVGFYNLWTAFLFLPGGLCLFYKEGVFAWDGMMAFWVVAVLFGGWYHVMARLLLRTVRDPGPDDGPPDVPADPDPAGRPSLA